MRLRTNYEIDERKKDGNNKSFRFHVSNIRPYFGDNAQPNVDYKLTGKKIKVLSMKNLFLTDKQISSDEVSFEDTDFVLTKSLINLEFENVGKTIKAFNLSTDYFNKVEYWTDGEKITTTTNSIKVYKSDPLIYDYIKVDDIVKTPENIKKITDIESNEIETNSSNYTVFKVKGLKGSSNEDLYISYEDKDKCFESALDWNKWFFINNSDTNKDIICDRTDILENLIKKFNNEIDEYKYEEDHLEKWWYGDYITNIYLQNALNTDGTGYEFARKIRKMLRRAVCYHPLEWDKSQFISDNFKNTYNQIVGSPMSKNMHESLKNESSKSDIWEGLLQQIFSENCFYFVNPIYFLRHLKKSKILDTCLCSEKWVWEKLTSIGIRENVAKNYIDSLNQTFNKFNMDTCLKKTHFLAQIMHESANLTATKEISPPENAESPPYIGRGFIQITWKTNYKAYGEYISEDVYTINEIQKKEKDENGKEVIKTIKDISNLEKLEKNPHAMLSAGWFWNTRSLNNFAEKNDLIEISRRINGAFNGFNDRLNNIKKIKNKIIKECDETDFNIDYKLENSACYENALGCFAWAVWHDKDGGHTGCTFDDSEAIKGYKRCIEIGSTEKNRYGTQNKESVYGKKDKQGELSIVDAATFRLKQLEK